MKPVNFKMGPMGEIKVGDMVRVYNAFGDRIDRGIAHYWKEPTGQARKIVVRNEKAEEMVYYAIQCATEYPNES